MTLLIDGYNLLHVTDIFGHGFGPPTLERSRHALLMFLAKSLDDQQRTHTFVVFDAKNAPPGLPRVIDYQGLTVYYAVQYHEADDLIEELIQADSAPKRMTVVSSDHRLQRAAHRRRARAVDSHRWYREILRHRHARRNYQQQRQEEDELEAALKPEGPLSEPEVRQWLKEFGESEGEALLPAEGSEPQAADPKPPAADPKRVRSGPAAAVPERPDDQSGEKPGRASDDASLANPFPPGYGEDVLEEEL